MRYLLSIIVMTVCISVQANNEVVYEKIDDHTVVYKEYNQKGQLVEKGAFLNEQKNGLWQSFDSEGNLASEINYKNGLKDGTCKIYEDQEVVGIIYYENNQQLMAEYFRETQQDLTISTKTE